MRTGTGLSTLALAMAMAFPSSGAHASTPRDATERYIDPRGARGAAKGAAADEILRQLTASLVPCPGASGDTRQCRLLDVAVGADVHYGTIPESGDHVALVTVRWNPVAYPEVVETRALVFVAAPGKGFDFVDASEIPGHEVFQVRFEPYRISYSAAYLRPDDPPSNPTGIRRYEIVHGAGRLKVRIRETDGDLPPARPTAFSLTERRDRMLDAIAAREGDPATRR